LLSEQPAKASGHGWVHAMPARMSSAIAASRARRRRLTPAVRGGLFAAALACSFAFAWLRRGAGEGSEDLEGPGARSLLSEIYPTELFSKDARESGAILLHVMGLLYMFVGLAKVCDEFFVPALEVIVEKLELDDDVAGATFMAAGGSAPELATSLLGVMSASAVGFGTIVGSAVFNVLFVIGMCALFSKELLKLTWWPLARDCSFYTIDLVVLYLFFRDKKIEWYEALILFLLYIGYVVFMKFNVQAERWVKKMLGTAPPKERTPSQIERGEEPEAEVHHSSPSVMDMYRIRRDVYTGALHVMIRDHRIQDDSGKALTSSKSIFQKGVKLQMELQQQHSKSMREAKEAEEAANAAVKAHDAREAEVAEEEKEEEEEEEVEGLQLSWPSDGSIKDKLTFVVLAPLNYWLWLIPDVRFEEKKKYYPISFIMSIAYIAFLSYWMVWWATTIGQTADIDDVIMGYTVLAAGTSIPDLLTSVLVARQGLGDMAVSSSIGSNIFDVTFGLPIPWLLRIAIDSGDPVRVDADSLGFSLVLLILMLVAVIFTIAASGWAMTKVLGFTMFCLYGIFLLLVLLAEYGVIEPDF